MCYIRVVLIRIGFKLSKTDTTRYLVTVPNIYLDFRDMLRPCQMSPSGILVALSNRCITRVLGANVRGCDLSENLL